MRVRSRLHRARRPGRVTTVSFLNILKDLCLAHLRPRILEFKPSPMGTNLRACDDKEFRLGRRADHGADIPPVEDGTGLSIWRILGEIPLEMEDCGPDGGHRGDQRSRFARLRCADRLLVDLRDIECLGCGECCRLVGRISSARPNGMPDGAVERSRVEVGEPVMRCQLAGERALAGCRRSIDGDDGSSRLRHCACPAKLAPRPRINPMKSGKLVTIMEASSTVTGLCAASPMIRKDMAIR